MREIEQRPRKSFVICTPLLLVPETQAFSSVWCTTWFITSNALAHYGSTNLLSLHNLNLLLLLGHQLLLTVRVISRFSDSLYIFSNVTASSKDTNIVDFKNELPKTIFFDVFLCVKSQIHLKGDMMMVDNVGFLG